MINKRNLIINTYNTDVLRYRGPADSTEINEILNSLKTNANNCILRTRKAEKKLDDLRKAYSYLNLYLSSKVRDLGYQSDNLLSNVTSGIATSILSFYDYNVTNSGVIDGLTVDSQYGQLTLSNEYSWSKVTRFTDNLGDKRATPDVKIYYDDTLRAYDNDAYNCLDSLNYTLWLEEATYAEHTIKLQLPKSIKPKINSLKIDFFPQFNCHVKSIEYYSVKGFWQTLSNFDSDGRSIYIHFHPYDYGDQIRFTVQPISEANPIIGIGNIDLYLNNYKNNGTATFPFPEVEKYNIASIDDIWIDYYIDNDSIVNQFNTINPLKVYLIIDTDTYEIPQEVINGSTKLNLKVGAINKKNIKIRFDLTEVNLTTPVIRGAKLSYTLA